MKLKSHDQNQVFRNLFLILIIPQAVLFSYQRVSDKFNHLRDKEKYIIWKLIQLTNKEKNLTH